MVKNNIKIYDLVDISSPQQTLIEIKYVLALTHPDFDPCRFEKAYSDIISLFEGRYPGYRVSNTKYHNLEHTCSVTLALVRLVHGLTVDGCYLTPRITELGVLAALFHDTGLIQTVDEQKGTGAQYTVGHEERSIHFMQGYLADKGFSDADIENCTHIIQCTILDLAVDSIPFHSDEIKTMGQVLGTADLIAQISDRTYLEKLPLLFMEFEEAGMDGFGSPLELFQKTGEFYHSVARKRLTNEMGGVGKAAQSHFRERWGIDRDLYDEAMQKNIQYAKKLETDCPDSYECLKDKLRRKVK